MNASYIWSRLRGDLNNLSDVTIPFLEPVIRPNVYGILPSDVPQRVVTWGVFSLPKKFTFSPILDVHSGYAYSNVDVLQNYVGTPNGQRFATYLSLDIKIYRVIQDPLSWGEERQDPPHSPWILFAQHHQSRQFQCRVQQRNRAKLRPVCRIFGPARRRDYRFHRLGRSERVFGLEAGSVADLFAQFRLSLELLQEPLAALAFLWAGILLEYEAERSFEAGEGAKAV